MLKSTHRPAGAPPPLSVEWTEHKAPTGHSYYYNARTQESTYSRPVEARSPAAQHAYGTESTHEANGIPHGGSISNYPSLSNSKIATQGNPLFKQQGNATPGWWDHRGGHNNQLRPPPKDRPKSKHPVPGCQPWVLVKTNLGRRFVFNPEEGKSFWKFPLDVMKGVVEYDRVERERKLSIEKRNSSGADDQEIFEAAEEIPLADRATATVAPAPVTRQVGLKAVKDDSEEYEEVEVTDNEDDGENRSKRQKTEDNPEQPTEFNEDDIAYQLAAMGQDYGLDPGEYGTGEDVDLEEGAQGLALTEEDSSALFKDMLDDHYVSPFTTWEKIIEAGQIVEDDRYTVLPNMKSRKEIWAAWSRDRVQRLKERREREEKTDPRISYLSFLQTHATPKLYWLEFRRKYKKEAEMRDGKLSDKEKEKWYRDYINRLKLPESTLKSDLVSLLKSIPLDMLNRSTTLEALPPSMLTDLRYISLRPSIRDPMIETYVTTLLSAPDSTGISPQEEEAFSNQKRERERREIALLERQRKVQEERRRQRGALEFSKGMLREGEEEIQRAMKVGKDGLRGYMEGKELVD